MYSFSDIFEEFPFVMPGHENESTSSKEVSTRMELDVKNKETQEAFALPEPMSDICLIENPSNQHEIFLMGGYLNNNIYTYNVNTNCYTKCKIDFSKLKPCTNQFSYELVGANCVTGIIPNTILIMGSFRGLYESFYTVFNTLTYDFQDVNNDARFGLFDLKYKLHGNGRKLIRFKNYLIVSGGYTNVPQQDTDRILPLNAISIFKICANSQSIEQIQFPKWIKTIKLRNNYRYAFHASIEISKDVENNRLKILLFGGKYMILKQSFCVIDLNLNQIECGKKGFDITYSPRDWINLTSNLECVLRNAYTSAFLRLYYFSYHYICNEYLLVMGGHTGHSQSRYRASRKILLYTFKTKQWSIYKFNLPKRVYGHSSIICKYNNSNCNKSKQSCIYIMGGCHKKDDTKLDYLWKWKIGDNLDWINERIIWIGFFKNIDNGKCLIDKLPKDVISYLLSFLRNCVVF